MSYGQTLENLVSRHMADQKAIALALEKAHKPYSLCGLIRSKMRDQGGGAIDADALETVNELSWRCRGDEPFAFNPSGTWVPFHALADTRDLNTGTPSLGGHLTNPR